MRSRYPINSSIRGGFSLVTTRLLPQFKSKSLSVSAVELDCDADVVGPNLSEARRALTAVVCRAALAGKVGSGGVVWGGKLSELV